jgi:hypothetical protein
VEGTGALPEEMAEITTWGMDTPTNSDTVARMPLISVGPNESRWYPPIVNSPATTSTHATVSTEEGPTILVGVAGGATGAAWGAVAFAVALGPAVPRVAFVPFVLLPAPPTEPEPLPEPEALDEALPDPEEACTITVAFLAGALPAAAESLLPAGSPSIESFTGTMCRRAVSRRSETWESASRLASAVTKKASARKTARIRAKAKE